MQLMLMGGWLKLTVKIHLQVCVRNGLWGLKYFEFNNKEYCGRCQSLNADGLKELLIMQCKSKLGDKFRAELINYLENIQEIRKWIEKIKRFHQNLWKGVKVTLKHLLFLFLSNTGNSHFIYRLLMAMKNLFITRIQNKRK